MLKRSLRHAKREPAIREVRRRVMVHLRIHLDARASCNGGLEQIRSARAFAHMHASEAGASDDRIRSDLLRGARVLQT